MKHTRVNIWRSLNKYLDIPSKLIIYRGLLALSITVLSLCTPYLYKKLVDDVMKAQNIVLLYKIVPAMIILYVFRIALLGISNYVGKKFFNLTNQEIKKKLMKRFLFCDISNVKGNVGGQMSNLEDDAEIVCNFYNTHVIEYVTSFFSAVVYLILMLIVSPWLGVFSVFFLPVGFYFAKMVGEKFNLIKKSTFEITSENREYLFETIRRWREIKSNVIEERCALEYNDRLMPERELNSKWMLYFGICDVVKLVKDGFVMKVLNYFIGGLMIIRGDMSIGELLMFMSYLESMNIELDRVIQSTADFVGQKALFERIVSILDEKLETAKRKCPDKPSILVNNVSFSYDLSHKSVFRGINCEFSHGKKYLLVGQSGEGKSSLVKLILGLNKADDGGILVNGIPIDYIDSHSLMKKFGAIMQENELFNLSIQENLQLISPSASEEDIRKAIHLSCLDEFVDSLPDKLQTVIGERGIKLSGGQKQRLAIARLILHNPEIVILDEATSALDSELESKIMDNLRTVFKEKTFIVISHRKLTNYKADFVYKIENKKIRLVQ